MGLLDSLFGGSMKGIGTSPLYVLGQRNKRWAEMHWNNLERYLAYRGHSLTNRVRSKLELAIAVNPEMTYKEFVDRFIDGGEE